MAAAHVQCRPTYQDATSCCPTPCSAQDQLSAGPRICDADVGLLGLEPAVAAAMCRLDAKTMMNFMYHG